MAMYSCFSGEKWWFSITMLVCQRVSLINCCWNPKHSTVTTPPHFGYRRWPCHHDIRGTLYTPCCNILKHMYIYMCVHWHIYVDRKFRHRKNLRHGVHRDWLILDIQSLEAIFHAPWGETNQLTNHLLGSGISVAKMVFGYWQYMHVGI